MDSTPQNQAAALTVDQAFQQAVAHHQAGRWQDAQRLYRAILQAQPRHPDANHNLGVLAVEAGQPAAGLACLKAALESDPARGQFWLSYIDALIGAERCDAARQVLARGRQQGLAGDAVDALALRLAGNESASPERTAAVETAISRRESGRFEEAAGALRDWLAVHPQDAGCHALLAQVLSLARKEATAWAAMNKALSLAPDLPIVQRNLARLLLKRNQPAEALQAARAAHAADAADAENRLVLAAALVASDQNEQARPFLEEILRENPNHAEALANRALLQMRGQRFAEALADAEKALSVKPHLMQVWALVGSLRLQLKDLPGAIEALQKALEYEPDNIDRMVVLGGLLRQNHEADAAIDLLQQTVVRAPDHAGAWASLGAALHESNRIAEARAAYARALAISPRLAEVYNNLGVLAQEEKNWEEALRNFEQALACRPDHASIMANKAVALNALGRQEEALPFIAQALQREENANTKTVFVNCIRRLTHLRPDGWVRGTLARALAEPWGRPSELAAVSIAFLKASPVIAEGMARALEAWPRRLSPRDLFGADGLAALERDALLHALLAATPVIDAGTERFLAMARFALLAAAIGAQSRGGGGETETSLRFHCALAHQCFANEYVFSHTEDELRQAAELRERLVAALEAEAEIPVLWPVAVAAYFPLGALPSARKLLDRQWPGEFMEVLARQVIEPEDERRLRPTMPRLTDIDDDVSLRVQNQYEENPYPRWIRINPDSLPMPVGAALRQLFPLADFRPLPNWERPEILIAGCGTGHHAISTALRFRGARVLAVDLSLASLCYAKRKTLEIGLASVEYAQADLLKLDSFGRAFDVIESCGVLHHLAQPFRGWQVLLSLLRPGGVMRLGFYSEAARRDIVRVRQRIAEKGYRASAEDIRRCRQDLIDSGGGAQFGAAVRLRDFFSMSGCRDLLFHVQEHRMTLGAIDAFLKENNLTFLGFEAAPEVFGAYRKRFPEDAAATDLARWARFEADHPDTFIGMYDFWVQKAA